MQTFFHKQNLFNTSYIFDRQILTTKNGDLLN